MGIFFHVHDSVLKERMRPRTVFWPDYELTGLQEFLLDWNGRTPGPLKTYRI